MPTEIAILDTISNSAPTLALALVMFMAGVMVPFPYAMERFRGFGRVIIAKLPYAPPPGQNTEEAMAAATAEDDPTRSTSDGGE